MWAKLKREWKTFLWSVLGVIIGAHDVIVAAGWASADFEPIIPEAYRPYVTIGYPLGMLFLRKWKDVVSK